MTGKDLAKSIYAWVNYSVYFKTPYMSLNFREYGVENNLYNQLKEEVESATASTDAVLDEVGKLSNGDSRPIVRFNQDADQQLLVIAGEDSDELGPVMSMPDSIRQIDDFEPTIGVNLVPYFDVTPSMRDFAGKDAQNYEELREALNDFKVYSGDELKEIANREENLSQKPYSLEHLDAIDEVLIHPDLVAIDADAESSGELLRRNLESAVDLLYDEVPDRFYIPFFGQEVTMTTFYKHFATHEENIVLHSKPLYACADEEPLPQELEDIVDFAKDCDYGITLHQNDADLFFILSYQFPKELTDTFRANANKQGADLDPLDNASEFYYDIKSVEKGAIYLDSTMYEMTTEFVKEGYSAAELPQDREKAEKIASSEIVDFVKYFNS